MKIIFFGTPSFVIPVLESLTKTLEVVAVVTTPDTVQGRKKIITPTPVKQWTLENLPSAKIFSPEQLTAETIKQLTDLRPDLIVTAAYGKIIPQTILDIPKLGSLNIHPSLLPKYRGPSPIQTAILNGDTETGVTIMAMDAELDHGPILAQEKIDLKGDETFASLHTELFTLAAGMLAATIEQLNDGALQPTPQDESKVVWCKKITKEDGYFDIENPPDKATLDRMIRAFYPWPTAWTKLKMANDEWRIVKLLPGKKIQLEGGNPMTIKDLLNGYPDMKELLEKLL